MCAMRIGFLIFFLFLGAIPSFSITPSWIDLPEENLEEILYYYDGKLDTINTLIKEYNSYKKGKWNNVRNRISKLNEISKKSIYLKGLFKDNYFINFLEKISEIALRKKEYLERLSYLRNNPNHIAQQLYNTKEIPEKFIPLTINNKKKYNYGTQEVWGEYLIEAADPSHRRLLNNIHTVWRKKFTTSSLYDFFLWLEDKPIFIFHPSIDTIPKDQLYKYKVFIKDGILYTTDNKLLNTKIFNSPDTPEYGPTFYKEHIFIINNLGEIFATYSGANTAHSSLSHYKPLIGSGKFFVKNGRIIKFAADSGHYLPTLSHFIQIIRFLLQKKVPFEDNVEVFFFDKHTPIKTTYGDFKKKYII